MNIKHIRFSDHLIKLVLSGSKDTTWRRYDDKWKITVGDQLSLCDKNQKEFAKANVIWVKYTTFGKLTKEDKEGHENFSSNEDMCQTYSKYFNIVIGLKSKLKVIKYKLL